MVSIPSSPTLSSQSTNFATTYNLRDYIPQQEFGPSSLGLLEPAGIITQPNATSISDTDGETFSSPTIRESQTPSVPPVDSKGKSKKKKKKKGDSADNPLTAHQHGIVAVTSDGTNDGPALKTANVGFSMGIAGTEVAKEASDIILMDDDFSSFVKAIIWGRCIIDSVRKFLQLQISTNVTAVVITFVSSCASATEASVLSAVQLLWINIIMYTFAALALATDPASEKLLDRKPDRKTAPLFSVEMYKMILLQSVYQVAMILVFYFMGLDILGLEHTEKNEVIVKTLIFNAFVFAQIFNSVNCRRLDSKLNIFEGILKNRYFMVITLLEIAIQIIIVFVGAFQVTQIGAREWGISLALGFGSIPWGAIIRLLPNGIFESLFKAIRLIRETEVLPTVQPEREGWRDALTMVRDNLRMRTFANIRGGRLSSSSLVHKSRQARLPEDDQLRIFNRNSHLKENAVLDFGLIVFLAGLCLGLICSDGKQDALKTCRILGVLRPIFILVHFSAALTTCGILLLPQNGRSSISCLLLWSILFTLGLCCIVIQVSLFAWSVGNLATRVTTLLLAILCALPGFYLVGLKWHPKILASERGDVEGQN